MWKPIESSQELESVFDESAERPVLIFKHSTRCPLSSMIKRRFEAEFDFNTSAPAYLLNIIENRGISNAVEAETGVRHESPQLLLLKKRVSYWDASHGAIDAKTTQERLLR